MKKIFISILVLFSIQSYGQLKLYAERKNADNTIDSFYTKGFLKDSVFNSQGVYICPTVEFFESTFDPVFPQGFGAFVKCADGIYRNNTIITSGTFTPILFNTTNVAASTAFSCAWVRVGSLITVMGQVSIDCITASSTATELGISLPVATNLVADASLAGTASSDQIASLSARIKADATNDRARIVFKAISTTNDTYSFTFTYLLQ